MVVDYTRLMDRPTPLIQSARPVAFIAMAVESECIIITPMQFISADLQMLDFVQGKLSMISLDKHVSMQSSLPLCA